MPVPISTVGEALAMHLDESGKSIISMSWPDFYSLNDARAIRESRKEELSSYLWDEHELLVSYGNRAIFVMKDKHINRVRL